MLQKISASTAERWITTGLITLAAQDLLLMLAGWARVQPHPPGNVMPFIGALTVLALRLALGAGPRGSAAFIAVLAVALLHLLNFGPHKLFAPHPTAIAPMVLVGLLMIGQVTLAAIAGLRRLQLPASAA